MARVTNSVGILVKLTAVNSWKYTYGTIIIIKLLVVCAYKAS